MLRTEFNSTNCAFRVNKDCAFCPSWRAWRIHPIELWLIWVHIGCLFPYFYCSVKRGGCEYSAKLRVRPTEFRYGCIMCLYRINVGLYTSWSLWLIVEHTFQSSSTLQVPNCSFSCQTLILWQCGGNIIRVNNILFTAGGTRHTSDQDSQLLNVDHRSRRTRQWPSRCARFVWAQSESWVWVYNRIYWRSFLSSGCVWRAFWVDSIEQKWSICCEDQKRAM